MKWHKLFKNKFIVVIAIVLVVVGIVFVLANHDLQPQVHQTLITKHDNDIVNLQFTDPNNQTHKLNLTVAASEQKKETGLMNIKSALAADSGMLFIYDKEQPLTFWMKNTFIPLDMIFLDKDLKVVKIHENTIPNQTTTLYPSIVPAQYVIELNGGWSKENGLIIGGEFGYLL